MNINYKQVALGALIGVILAVGAGFIVSRSSMSPSLGAVVGVGQVQTQTFWFYNGLYAGTTQQFIVSSAGAVTIGGGTAINKYSCATATWNPGSIGTSSVNVAATSTDIALPGAVMGDVVAASLTSATTSVASIEGFMSGTATATIRLVNLGTVALDLATGTAKVCYTH